jgi:hypothetical protein
VLVAKLDDRAGTAVRGLNVRRGSAAGRALSRVRAASRKMLAEDIAGLELSWEWRGWCGVVWEWAGGLFAGLYEVWLWTSGSTRMIGGLARID